MVKLYYVRHGQAQHNLLFNKIGKNAYVHPSVIDSSLTDKGSEQAIQLGKQIRMMKTVSIIIVSPLTRCLETTERIICELPYKPKVIALDELIEWTATDTPNHRKAPHVLKEQFPFVDFSNINPDRSTPKMDSTQDLKRRIEAYRQYIDTLSKDERVIVVGHTSWMNQMLFNDVERKDLQHAHIYESRDDDPFVLKDLCSQV